MRDNKASKVFLDGVAASVLIGVESIISSFKDDVIAGNSADNTINGGSGDDLLNGGSGIDTLSYSTRSEAISVILDGRTEVIASADGLAEDKVRNFESVTGGGGSDSFTGDKNNNKLLGNSGDDTLFGLSGEDVLLGGSGIDTLNGGGGADRFIDDTGADTMDGSSGNDTLSYGERFKVVGTGITVTLAGSADVQVMVGAASEDTIRNVENIFGGLGNDKLTGDGRDNVLMGGTPGATTSGDGNDTLSGAGGDDVLDGGAYGNDTLDGAKGKDTASFAMALSGVTVNLSLAGAQNTIGAGFDSIAGCENILGSSAGDTLTGSKADNVLDGGGGSDTLAGKNGDDTLDGGEGRDVLTGGSGADRFVITDTQGRDLIADFQQGTDHVDLSRTDAILGGGDDIFIFVGTAAFSETAGELRFEQQGGVTVALGDVDGDGLADVSVAATSSIAFVQGDFLL